MIILFYFILTAPQFAGSYFPNQGLNLGPGSQSTEP